MGQVAFWGSVHGQVGTTSNVIAAACMIGLEYSTRTLVAQTQHTRSTLETAFSKLSGGGSVSKPTFDDKGLDALDRMIRSNRLTSEGVRDYTQPIIQERLDLLSGTEKADEATYHAMNDTLQPIFDYAKRYYNTVLLDVHSGCGNPVTNQLLAQSELIVVCLNQNVQVLDRFFAKKDWPQALNDKPYMILLGQYDPHSKYKLSNIARKYNVRVPMYTVPYCTPFRDACNDRDVRSFFMRMQHSAKDTDTTYFMNEVRKLSKAILTEIGINVSVKAIERGVS
ncbi:chromosome partitioning protein ParA [Paenibacillus sp. ACRRX]|uniref:chromosome partitioning protein ParA n=1 Tax=unclassified Paenibacillus TaxID=185978 RepID=UPI001EF51915|nr:MULTISPECIES: chromosome partitioning protein ParA [unclassified Paenibacillus]MCG7409172.1 chromosome partitioning protein ParA [Paenibacillus sp. ACRRX]MDK8181834.1 chromosome partitioning protein ParA [Paenibacillus sp. UMB4589-SE434]